MPSPIRVTTGWAKKCTGMNSAKQPHDAERARDGQAADDAGEGGGDDATEDEEQHHADQRDGGDLGTFLVLADAARQLAGQRLKAGLFDVDAGDVQRLFDRLPILAEVLVVVVQDLRRRCRP